MRTRSFTIRFLFICSLCLHVLPLNAQESVFKNKYSLESARELIGTAKLIQQGEKISDEHWGKLFQTDGYRRFLAMSDSLQFQQWIQDAILLSFDKSRRREADSIAGSPMDLDSPTFMRALIAQNFYRLSEKDMDEVSAFLDTTDFVRILEQAIRRTKEFLPVRAYEDNPELNNIYMVGREAEASVRDHCIFLDLNLAMDFSEQQLIDLLAHEFHHNYREMKIVKRPADPALRAINSFQSEGIADLINKREFTPLDEYGPEVAEMYSQDFYGTPEKLMKIDSVTQAYLTGQADRKAYAGIGGMINFGGHTNGFYMALVIKNAGGLQDLIDTYDNPVEFVKLYNRAASMSEKKEYIFTPGFISHLEKLWEEYKTGIL